MDKSFADKNIERIVYKSDGSLDEIVLTGDVHIEWLHDDVWMVQIGGVHLRCKDLKINWVDDEVGKVPEKLSKEEWFPDDVLEDVDPA